MHIKLRDNFAADTYSDNFVERCSDTAIRGEEKCICCLCLTDIVVDILAPWTLISPKKDTAKR